MKRGSRLSQSQGEPEKLAREIAGRHNPFGCIRNIGLMVLVAYIWLWANATSPTTDAMPVRLMTATPATIPPAILTSAAPARAMTPSPTVKR